MGKSVPSSTRLIKEFGRVTAEKLNSSKTPKPKSGNRFFKPETSKSGGDLEKLKLKMEIPQRENRMPLKEVVSDCAKRWFQDTLKEAKAGDSGMQVLVGQMYYSGYGITKDAQKGKAWISKASRSRSMVGKVSDKHPVADRSFAYNPHLYALHKWQRCISCISYPKCLIVACAELPGCCSHYFISTIKSLIILLS